MVERKLRRERAIITLSVIKSIRAQSAWCCKVHIQKAAFILQQMLKVDYQYKFERYIYGPYCFELTENLFAYRLQSLIAEDTDVGVRDNSVSYMVSKDISEYLESIKNDEDMPKLQKKIDFVVDWLGQKRTEELEKLAATYIVMRDMVMNEGKQYNSFVPGNHNHKKVIKDIKGWKPHLSAKQIKEAIKVVKAKQQESQNLINELG